MNKIEWDEASELGTEIINGIGAANYTKIIFVEKCWRAMEANGLTSYRSIIELQKVKLRLVAIVNLLVDFNSAIDYEDNYIDCHYWKDSLYLNDIVLGYMLSNINSSMFLEEEGEVFDSGESILEEVFPILVKVAFNEVRKIILKEFVNKSRLFVALHLTIYSEVEIENNFTEIDSLELFEESLLSESDSILSDVTVEALRGFEWVSATF